MAYTKTTWRTDDVITAEKLNNAEQGIAQSAAQVQENTDDIDQLKGSLEYAFESGNIETTESLNWINAYVNTNGVVASSSLSKAAVIPMQAGEKIEVGTNDKNITIIGCTTADSVSIGDIITIIQKTGTVDQWEDHTYTVPDTTNIVVCVLKSNYTLKIYRRSGIVESFDDKFDKFVGCASRDIVLSANIPHSSLIDTLNIDIGVGDEFILRIDSNDDTTGRSVVPILYGAEATELSAIAIGVWKKYTATKAANRIGFWVSSDNTSATLTVKAVKTSTLLFDAINEDLLTTLSIGCEQAFFTVGSNATHSSGANQIPVNVNNGDLLYILLTGINNSSVAFWGYTTSSGSEFKILREFGNAQFGKIYLVKSTADNVNRIGVYMTAQAAVRNVTFAIALPKKTAESIFSNSQCEYDTKFTEKLLSAKRRANSNDYLTLTTPEVFTLVHFTDIHGHSDAMCRIQLFRDTYASHIDDTICTGDMVQDKLSDGLLYLTNNSDGSILLTIGNHDSNTGDWVVASQSTLYDTFIAPFKDNWNAVTVTNKSYWYKDYAIKKIRLISIDGTISDNTEKTAQITWLSTVLADALENEYTVIGAIHFVPMPEHIQKIDCNFSAKLHTITSITDMYRYSWGQSYDNDIMGAVQSFIDNGGDFACWLCGHTHWNMVSYDDRYPKQIFITNTCATPISQSDECDRSYSMNKDAINVVCVDIIRKYIKVLRYGVEYDDIMRHMGSIVLGYGGQTPSIINQD